jgi:predicted nucleic acid-binding Zn ribbon protein
MVAKKAGAKAPALVPSGHYRCPSCGNSIRVFVKLVESPSCLRHSDGAVKMEVSE